MTTSVRTCALAAALLWALCLAAPEARADEPARGDLRAAAAAPADAGAGRLRRGVGWDVTLEGALTIHEDPEGVLGERSPAGDPAFEWSRHSYDPVFGARLTIGRPVRGDVRWELRGSWLGQADDSSRQTGRFGFRATPASMLQLSPTASATLTSETELWSVELNRWATCSCSPCSQLDWGVGARVITLDDRVSATDWVGLAQDSELHAQARNRFLGAQLMAAWRQRPSPRFQLSVSGKALVGWMHRDLTERDVSILTGGVTTDAERKENGFGWGLEGEIAAIWRIRPRIGLTAAYTVLYLSDATRIGKVLDLGQAMTGSVQLLDGSDSALVHSFFLGVRIDL